MKGTWLRFPSSFHSISTWLSIINWWKTKTKRKTEKWTSATSEQRQKATAICIQSGRERDRESEQQHANRIGIFWCETTEPIHALNKHWRNVIYSIPSKVSQDYPICNAIQSKSIHFVDEIKWKKKYQRESTKREKERKKRNSISPLCYRVFSCVWIHRKQLNSKIPFVVYTIRAAIHTHTHTLEAFSNGFHDNDFHHNSLHIV